MAVKEVVLTKAPNSTAVVGLVRGDNRTQIIRFVVDRYEGGVDLSGLTWSVFVQNADNETDYYTLETVQITDTEVIVEWLVRGITTSVAGTTQFELEGIAQDGETKVWQSGSRTITVYKDLNGQISGEEDLTEVQKLILYVRHELPEVIVARDAANDAADRANGAAANADAAIEELRSEAVVRAEKERVAAEEARKKEWAVLKPEVEAARDAANDAADRIDDEQAHQNALIGALYNLRLDGTPETYQKVMKEWFLLNDAENATPVELSALCDRWYTLTRDEWDGGVKFYKDEISAVSDGIKMGDNAGLECIPSTDSEANTDDYAGLPLFACVDVNWIIDSETLEPQITAIDGITSNFERQNPDKFVGVMQMAGYRYEYEAADEGMFVRGYCSTPKPYADIEPVHEAIRAQDNSVRPWVVHGKYMGKIVDGKLRSYAGVIPTAYTISHNTLHACASANGSQYSGGSVVDNAWLQTMAMIKYGSLTQDGKNQGCVSYNYQYPAAVSETGVSRIVLTAAQATNLIIGSNVLIGNYNGSLDRGDAGMYSITGQGGATIRSIEDVTIDGTAYKAVNVDCGPFDTAANGAQTTGTTYVSTFHWKTGTCDNVRGNDGSPVAPGGGKYPAKIQGIEYSVGGYEIYADVILNLFQEDGKYYYEPYTVNRSTKQATSITANYVRSGLRCDQPAADGWNYIKAIDYANGFYFPVRLDGSSSTYYRDGFYQNANAVGTREWLAFGHLGNGSGGGGLSYLHGNWGLSWAGWRCLARLSPNGNRGELTA